MVARRKGVVLGSECIPSTSTTEGASTTATINHPDKSLTNEGAFVRVRLPGTVFEVDEKGIVYYPEKLLKKLLTN